MAEIEFPITGKKDFPSGCRVRIATATNRCLWLLPVICLAGCVGTTRSFEGDVADPSEHPLLIGRFAEEPVRNPLVIREAYIGDERFFVSYDDGGEVFYSGGTWSNRIDIQAVVDAQSDTYAGPYILPLEYQQRERWPVLPEQPIEPRILSAEQWHRFHDDLFVSVIPRSPGTGLAMHFDADDYFLFYNRMGNFEARLLTEKPGDYRVVERIDFKDFMRRGLPELDRFLKAEGIEERRIVFQTGDVGSYSLPFLYVDLDLPIAVFVRFATEPRVADATTTGTQMAQSLGHVAQSHLGGLAIRPVSSVYRLLFVATDAAIETARPTWLVNLENQPIPPLYEGPGMDLQVFESELDRITGRAATRGTLEYLIDGDEYFTRFIDAVSSATSSIDIRTYIFDNDDYSETIGNLLKKRAGDGVGVRVLLDGLGTILATGVDDETAPEDHVAPASVRRFLEEGSDIDVRQAKNPWLAGDHVKTTVVDDRIAFTGGMNIGREYRYTWHDIMVEARGPVVDVLRREFDKAWAHAGPLGDFGYMLERLKPNRQLAEDTGYPVRVLFTRTGNAEIFRAQLAAIRGAKRYIYVQNAYFTDDAMLYELARARRRGVDVRVILPLVGNHGPINKSNALAANAMLEHGIRVFLYPGMSHIKAAVFDGWACFGSANWDKLSFRVNRELNIATSNPGAVEEFIARLFDTDFGMSVELTEPFPVSWSDHLVEVLADYLL